MYASTSTELYQFQIAMESARIPFFQGDRKHL